VSQDSKRSGCMPELYSGLQSDQVTRHEVIAILLVHNREMQHS
jgi:hypothetical protein